MALEQSNSRPGEQVMVCDCKRAGPDWEACDLPVVPLLCDGDCSNKELRERYRVYLDMGGQRWSRGVASLC